jgi:hypothetical protein
MKNNTLTKINECRSCANQHLRSFFDLGEQPFANALLKSPDDDDRSYPLTLCYCPDCTLVQLEHTAEPEELFSHYIWVTGTSSTARSHAENFCDNALSRLDSINQDTFVLEIASNDGTFLKPFISKGMRVLGLDPASNIVEQANEDGVPSVESFFGYDTAKQITETHGHPDLVIVRNVMPHVANLNDFMKGIRFLLAANGLAAIEFHYGKVIQDEIQYDSIYHEHLCYFTAKSADALLRKHQLKMVDVGESPISGGSLITYVRSAGAVETNLPQKILNNELSARTNELMSWQTFADRSFEHRKQLLQTLTGEISEGRRVAGYGASARSSTLLNFCGIDNRHLDMIADQNTLKNGLFTAGSHIPIHRPEIVMERTPDTFLILAWNFLDEITEILRDKLHFSGRLISPLPNKITIMDI